MHLYRISQSINNGYDTYDSAVVAAESDDAARKISPDSYRRWSDADGCWMFLYDDGRDERASHPCWVEDLDLIKVELIGVASGDIKPGVVVASFNAG